jgi:hypothetical protein
MVSKGINIRHIGRVRAKVNSKRWKDSLLGEVIARVIKNNLREKMRSQMEQVRFFFFFVSFFCFFFYFCFCFCYS